MLSRKITILSTITILLAVFWVLESAATTDTLQFSGDENYPPFSFIDKHGNPAGFTVDLLSEVAAQSGFEYQLRLENWEDAYKNLQMQKADAIIGMLRSEDRKQDFLFSTPHSYLSYMMILRPGIKIKSFSQIKDFKVLVLKNDVMHQYLLKIGMDKNLATAKSFDELFTLFNSGKGDMLIVSKIHTYFYYKKYELSKYKITPLSLEQFPFCFAVQNNNTSLQAQINEALYILHQNGRFDALYDKWFAAKKHETMPQFLSEYWRIAAIFLVVLVIAFILWNSSLSRKVNSQNHQLKEELNAKTIAEKQSKTVLERLTIAQNSAGIGIWELNLTNMDLYWDEGMFQLYEIDDKLFDATYNEWLSSLHPDDRDITAKKFEDCIKNKQDYDAVFRIITPSGNLKYIRAFAKLALKDNKKAIKAVGVNWDVTKAMKDAMVTDVLHAISQAAIFSENLVGFMDKIRQELSRVVDTTNFFIGLIEEDSGKLYLPYMKDNVEEFTYFPIRNSISSHVINLRQSMLFYAEDLDKLHKEGVIERAGGQAKVWLGVPLQIENQVIGLIVLQSYTDRSAITPDHVKLLEYIAPQLSLSIKRKKIQDELVKSEEVLRKITGQLKEAQVIARMGNFEWDDKNRKFAFSDEIYNIFGVKKEATNPDFETFMALVHSSDSQNIITVLNEANSNKTSFETEFRIFNKETGEPRIIIIKGQPVMQNGVYSGSFTGILQDITEQKDIEYELMAAKIKAEQSDKLKSAFLANMSHEIRTPMNSILGFSQILTEAEDEAELEKYTNIINKNGEHLLRLIDDIIDISKIEAGLVKVDKHTIDLLSLAETAIFQFDENDKVKDGSIELRLVRPENPIGLISSDQTKIKQVLINLIFNALKFTQSGFIELRYQLCNNQRVRFEVEDTGIGIPEDRLLDIFDRFMQVNANEVSKTTGAGLGLSLCKAYVKLLGGEIWVESTLGKGSTFSFEVPFEYIHMNEIARDVTPQVASALKSAPTILIAEDDTDSYYFFEAVMQKSGFRFIHVENGQDAVEIAKTNPEIDLVMIDIRMPLMDGLTATKLIKSARPNLPVIAQTAHAMDSDRQKAMEAGCDDYISKPVQRKILLEKINNLLSNKNSVAGEI
ncbi:MAG: transporter substrate-binding domain-containing protein [Bacteroidales bacterium]|nr:transporter substrate-binding domain-containing protein [Bacteroidales bacterium]